MTNVALSMEEFTRALKFGSLLTTLLGLLLAAIRHYMFGDSVSTAVLLGFTGSISFAMLTAVWLLKRPWRIERLARLTGRPIIHGVWFGHLQTNYHSDNKSNSIPIAFVIKQTYLGYSLLSYTESQASRTLITSLSVDLQHNTAHLRYMYEFNIRKSDEMKLTTGAAELTLVESGRRLQGHYLTNSPTRGSADLTLVDRDCDGIDTFEAAQKRYLEKQQ